MRSLKISLFSSACAFACLVLYASLTSCGSRSNESTLSRSMDAIMADCEQTVNPSNNRIEFSVFKNGDLIFVADTSSFSSAVAESTGGAFSHVGIIQRVADTLYVLEAVPRKGVVRTPIEKFIAEAPKDENGRPEIKVKRLFRIQQLPGEEKVSVDSLQKIANLAVEKAIAFLGTPYDLAFFEGAEELYCSELIYESFLQGDVHIFPVVPMNFKDSTGEISSYWNEYYKKLGKAVPQDWPGTNPNDLYKSDLLKEIAF